MEIKNRQRGGHFGKTPVFTNKKVKYNFDLSILDLMCSYVLSQNSHIKRGNLINMRNLFEVIDETIYEKDPEKMNRIIFIKKGILARLENDLKDPTLILAFIKGGIVDTELDRSSFPELSTKELQYIDETVSGALSSTYIDKEMDNFFELYTKYKAQDYRYRDEMNAEIEEFVSRMHNYFRKIKANKDSVDNFTLRGEEFENSCSDIYDKVTSPSRFLYCMMQGMNQMIGGFESTRVYLYLGSAGIGKSMLLLNLALQMKKANKGYKPKDPTKIPTILLLTQENGIDETVQRICNMLTGKAMSDFSKQDIIDILRNDGELMLSEDNNININIVYKPDRSIDTGDLYSIIEDLEDDGYEVIALFQDHIKRIRSVDSSVYGDLRLELGAVTNEFKILAQLKEIPVITVSHLNRDAAKVIDSMSQSNKTDLTRMLGRSNVGESMLMIDNADYVMIANREMDIEGNEYLVLKLDKSRNSSKMNNVANYICLPFESGSGTKLIEDLYSPMPAYKITLIPETQLNKNDENNMKMGINIKSSSYTTMTNIVEDDEPNIFDSLSGSKYSSTTNSMININYSSIVKEEEKSSFITWN